ALSDTTIAVTFPLPPPHLLHLLPADGAEVGEGQQEHLFLYIDLLSSFVMLMADLPFVAVFNVQISTATSALLWSVPPSAIITFAYFDIVEQTRVINIVL